RLRKLAIDKIDRRYKPPLMINRQQLNRTLIQFAFRFLADRTNSLLCHKHTVIFGVTNAIEQTVTLILQMRLGITDAWCFSASWRIQACPFVIIGTKRLGRAMGESW